MYCFRLLFSENRIGLAIFKNAFALIVEGGDIIHVYKYSSVYQKKTALVGDVFTNCGEGDAGAVFVAPFVFYI